MADEDYEILPHKEILEIKKEIQKLKGSPGSVPKNSLETSINKLSTSIDMLINLFKTASEDIKMERHDDKLLIGKIDPLLDKFNMVIEQNEKIAKGIVAVADMVKTHAEEKEAEKEIKPEPVSPPPMRAPEPTHPFMPGGQPQQFQPQQQQQPQQHFGPPQNAPNNNFQQFNPAPMDHNDDFGAFNPPPSGPGPSYPPGPNGMGPDQPLPPSFGGPEHSDGLGDMPPPPGDFGDMPPPPNTDKKGFFGKFKK